MSADDDLDRLYAVAPDEFTALRGVLAAAAKKRGDGEAAASIAAARRPTVAAWVVNTLVRSDVTVRTRLGDLAGAMRAAHAAMDGGRIRELTAAQRTLIASCVKAAFVAAGIANPSAALRDAVTNTLQAAVADPGVAARLGRLEKAEEWSGFGDFGVSTVVGAPRRTPKPDPAPEPAVDDGAALRAATERQAEAAAAVDEAAGVHAHATELVDERRQALIAARNRYEELLAALGAAEHGVDLAETGLADARTAEAEASEAVVRAKEALAEADSVLAAIRGD